MYEYVSCCESHMIYLSAMMPPVILACLTHAEARQSRTQPYHRARRCHAGQAGSSALPASFWVCEKDRGDTFAAKEDQKILGQM